MKISEKLKIALKSILSVKLGEVATDKAVLVFDGEELVEGMAVYVLDENGEAQPAEDGDYTVEDGKVIKVVDGKVAEIVDPKAEVAEEPVEETAVDIKEEVNEEVAPADEAVEEEEPAEEIAVEDRIAALEEKLAAFTEVADQFMNGLAALEQRIAELEGKMASVEAPAAEPIDENPVVENAPKSRLSYLRKN